MADKLNTIHMGPGVSSSIDAFDPRRDRMTAADVRDIADVNDSDTFNKGLGISGASGHLAPTLNTVRVVAMENGKALVVRSYAGQPNLQDRLRIHAYHVTERLPYINNGSSVTFLPRGTWFADRKGVVSIAMRGPTIVGPIEACTVSTIIGVAAPGTWSGVPLGYLNDGPYTFDAPYSVPFPTWCLRFDGYDCTVRAAPFVKTGATTPTSSQFEATLWLKFSGADKPWYMWEPGLGTGPPFLFVRFTTFPAHIYT